MTSSLKTVTLAGLLQLAAKEPQGSLIDDVPVFPRAGLVLLVGEPLAGKSSFCACVAAAMAVPNFLAQHRVMPGRVMWAAGEHTAADAASKFSRALRGVDADCLELDDEVTFLREPGWTLDTTSSVTALAEHLTREGTKLVVLDSLRRFSTTDENVSHAMADVLKQARELVTDPTGVSTRLVVLIHHLGRNGLPRGSTDLKAAVDSLVTIEATPTGWRISAEPHTAAPSSWNVVVTQTNELLRVDDFVRTAAGRSNTQVLEAVRQALAQGKPLGRSALRDAVRASGVKAKSAVIDACVRQLEAKGVIAVRTAGARVLHTLADNANQTTSPSDTSPAPAVPLLRGGGTGTQR